MQIESEVKFKKGQIISHSEVSNTKITDELETLTVFNGIYTIGDIINTSEKIKSSLILECSNNIPKTIGNLKSVNDYVEFLSSDKIFAKFNLLILSNFHETNVYSDLIVGTFHYIQCERGKLGFKPLKLVIFTYPKSIKELGALAETCIIYNIGYKSIETVYNIEEEEKNFNATFEKINSTISQLFLGKLGKFCGKSADKLKVLLYLPTLEECRKIYIWLNNNVVKFANAYLWIYDSGSDIKAIHKYDCVLVLTYLSNKSDLELLNLDFDVVIDSGFVSQTRLNSIAAVNIDCLVRIDYTQSITRNYCYNSTKNIISLQIYSSNRFQKQLIDKKWFYHEFTVYIDITNFIFNILTLGSDFLTNFHPVFYYQAATIHNSINNLLKSKLIEKKPTLSNWNNSNNNKSNEKSKLKAQLLNFQLTDFGRKCSKLKIFDCRSGVTFLYSVELGCSIECLTLLTMLEVSSSLLKNLLVSSEETKLKELYNAQNSNLNDFEFFLFTYRYIAKMTNEERSNFYRNHKVEKGVFVQTAKLRMKRKQWMKENEIDLKMVSFKSSKNNVLMKCLIKAYPQQVAQYRPETGMYYRYSITDKGCGMLIDPISFVLHKNLSKETQSPPNYVFYYSAYIDPSNSQNVYMRYVSSISEEMWRECIELTSK